MQNSCIGMNFPPLLGHVAQNIRGKYANGWGCMQPQHVMAHCYVLSPSTSLLLLCQVSLFPGGMLPCALAYIYMYLSGPCVTCFPICLSTCLPASTSIDIDFHTFWRCVGQGRLVPVVAGRLFSFGPGWAGTVLKPMPRMLPQSMGHWRPKCACAGGSGAQVCMCRAAPEPKCACAMQHSCSPEAPNPKPHPQLECS